jgi:hypothetical protein
VIDWALRKAAAWFSRRRVIALERRAQEFRDTEEWFIEWKRDNPGRCAYCRYTRWAREEQGVYLKIGVHDCIEGNSPIKLPRAKMVRS